MSSYSYLLLDYTGNLFPGPTSRQTEMPNCIISLPLPTLAETAMEALPLAVIYIFQDELDLILKMC